MDALQELQVSIIAEVDHEDRDALELDELVEMVHNALHTATRD